MFILSSYKVMAIKGVLRIAVCGVFLTRVRDTTMLLLGCHNELFTSARRPPDQTRRRHIWDQLVVWPVHPNLLCLIPLCNSDRRHNSDDTEKADTQHHILVDLVGRQHFVIHFFVVFTGEEHHILIVRPELARVPGVSRSTVAHEPAQVLDTMAQMKTGMCARLFHCHLLLSLQTRFKTIQNLENIFVNFSR